jgi:CrcB protein
MNSIMPFLYVGLGGFVGAILRYATSLASQNISLIFPYGTVISNLTGCFIIGIVVELAADSDMLSPETRLFLATGLCGGFTTLSSMIYEFTQLLRDNEILIATIYFAVTFLGAMLCFFLGVLTIQLLLKS